MPSSLWMYMVACPFGHAKGWNTPITQQNLHISNTHSIREVNAEERLLANI